MIEALIDRYQVKNAEAGNLPTSSELVREAYRAAGLHGLLTAYVQINRERAKDHVELLLLQDKPVGVTSEKLLVAIYAGVVTPFESVGTLIGIGSQIQRFNRSLGAVDWPDSSATKRKKEASQKYIEEGRKDAKANPPTEKEKKSRLEDYTNEGLKGGKDGWSDDDIKNFRDRWGV